MSTPDDFRVVLTEFVNDINATEGVWTDHKGNPRPMGDPEWIDIGFTYLRACETLGVEPMLSKVAPDGYSDESEEDDAEQ